MNIEVIRGICTALPFVTEDVKWEDNLCFLIGGKIFCVAGLNVPFRVSLKVSVEEFDELASSSDIIPAPYLARYKWIQVQRASRFNRKEWELYIAQSYNLVRGRLPQKVRRSFEKMERPGSKMSRTP